MKLEVGRCNIPDLLRARGWKQRDLVAKTGIDRRNISAICTGRSKEIALLTAVIIADALECNPRDLFEWVVVKSDLQRD